MLDGVSSVGKTTLASVFRDDRAAVGDFWLLMGIDDVLSKLPAAWLDLGYPTGPGPQSRDGLWFETEENGVRLHVGVICRKILDVYHRVVADAVRAGLNVIVDDVVIDRATLDSWIRALDGLDPTWVAVRCAREVAVRRERERGDRPIGMASAQRDAIHSRIPYAFEIDTGTLMAAQALGRLKQQLGLEDNTESPWV